MRVPPVVLSIAGYDPSSGAGITADVKTAAAHDCYAATCITAYTVQSTQGVLGVQPLDGNTVSRTLKTVADDLEIKAVRLGMLGSGDVATAVADFLEAVRLPNVVLDPVIRSSSGAALLDAAGLDVMKKRLIPLCDVLTPNIHEAAVLVNCEPPADLVSWEAGLPQLRALAGGIHRLGAKAVVITGGHQRVDVVAGAHIESHSTHGTGCAYAMAMACRLALGDDLTQSARAAKEYVRRAIQSAYPLGKGIGPINHFG
jgi:hydroxymethylpyrimidine/phosphomethylpyrimidine kinase